MKAEGYIIRCRTSGSLKVNDFREHGPTSDLKFIDVENMPSLFDSLAVYQVDFQPQMAFPPAAPPALIRHSLPENVQSVFYAQAQRLSMEAIS